MSARLLCHRLTAVAVAIVAFALAGAPAHAHIVSGHVVDEQGAGIWNVDLDFFDRDLGEVIFTPNDNTDFAGAYSVDVPTSEYDILFNAPAGGPWMDLEVRQVDISGPTTLDVTLLVGHAVSGTVTSPQGAPLFNVDLNFRDLATGDIIDTNDDNTDISGAFSVLVPAATYDIFFTAPVGQPWAGGTLESVTISADTNLGAIVLQPGVFLSGTLRGPGGVAAAFTDLDVEDPLTGEAIYTPRDNTDALGAFSLAIPAGTWDVIFSSPAASGWAWKASRDLVVNSNTSLGIVTLEHGFAVTGTIRDESAVAMAGADLDLLDANGDEVPMPDDNAGPGGVFSLLAAAGTYDIEVSPPTGIDLAATVVRDVVVSGATALGTITLPTGYSVSGFVRASGVGVAAVDLNAFEVATGFQHPTPHDDTAVDGSYSIRLPGGNWRLVATPPVDSGLPTVTQFIQPLAADTILDFNLSGATSTPDIVRNGSEVLLHPSAPNPFRSATTLRFEIPRDAVDARLTIHDLSGRAIRSLAPFGPVGDVVWDGRDNGGRRVASGVYWVRLETARGHAARQVTVLR